MGRKSHSRRTRVKIEDLSERTQNQLSASEINRAGKRHKIGRITVSKAEERTVDNIVFASKLEAKFYTHLKKVIPAGELHLQPEFLLQDKFRDSEGKMVRSIVYKSDFLLGPARANNDAKLHRKNIVIDAKGHLTDIFRLKAKLFLYRNQGHRLWTIKSIKALDEVVALYMENRDA